MLRMAAVKGSTNSKMPSTSFLTTAGGKMAGDDIIGATTTADDILKLRNEIEEEIKAGASMAEVEEWAVTAFEKTSCRPFGRHDVLI